MTKRKNVRSLDEIADGIHNLERANIIEIGYLLIEAKAQCQHGQWLQWVYSEFEWSVDTAQRYIKVAELSSKFRILRNLKLGATTLYDLADHENQEDLPDIVEELSKHAARACLRPRDARRVIEGGMGR